MTSSNDKVLSHIVGRALSGEGAHAGTRNAFDGLDWKIAAMRPPGVPHSIFQLLAHTTYWQNWGLQWLDGKDPAVPRHAAGSWPSNPSPASPDGWKRVVRSFRGSPRAEEFAVRIITVRCYQSSWEAIPAAGTLSQSTLTSDD